MALIRIGVACIFLSMLVLLFDDSGTWYGANNQSIVAFETARLFLPSTPHISLLTFVEPSSTILISLLAAGFCAGLALLVGWHSRVSAIISFVVIQSLLRRNPFVVSAADELMSQMLFYLALSDAGILLSLDNKRLKKKGQCPPMKTSPWAQRLLQIQICLIYLQTVLLKFVSKDWQSGDAVYNVLRSSELAHFPVPLFISSNLDICRLLSWATLGIEFAIPLLIWWRPVRLWIVILGITLHLSMEYCLNIPFFQGLMIVGLISFIDASTLKRAGKKLSDFFERQKAPQK
jgi:hypothetical protein